jgi:hypothetical protein
MGKILKENTVAQIQNKTIKKILLAEDIQSIPRPLCQARADGVALSVRSVCGPRT